MADATVRSSDVAVDCADCVDSAVEPTGEDLGGTAVDAQSRDVDMDVSDIVLSDSGDTSDVSVVTDVMVSQDAQVAQCGNGTVEAPEVCDDSNTITESCVYGAPSCMVCAADCTEVAGAIRVCGDNVNDPEEACDDGNVVNEGCDYGESSCTVCAAECTAVAGAIRVCGDGVTDPEEGCDDANAVDGDRCTNQCAVNQFCADLPGRDQCADRDNYSPGLREHYMVSIDGCRFDLDAPSQDAWTFGNQRVIDLINRTNQQRSIDAVLDDLNRSGRRGITNLNATRLTNHDWFGFNWDDGDSDVSYWYPQGITGSSDARPSGYVSGKRLILVSWYHKTESRPTKGARVSLADITDPDDIDYRHILLVEPYITVDGETDFKATETESGNALHVGGIVWYGDYLFVADTAKGIRVFDFSRLIEVSSTSDTGRIGFSGNRSDAHGYKYIAVQVARYIQPDDACYFNFSALALDLSSNPPTMVTSEYRSGDVQGRLVHWPVDVESGLLLDIDGQVRGRNAQSVGQSKIQGAVSWQGNYYISSSGQYQSFGRLYRTRPGMESSISAWVYGAEDLYYERISGMIWTPAEHPDFRDTVGIPLRLP